MYAPVFTITETSVFSPLVFDIITLNYTFKMANIACEFSFTASAGLYIKHDGLKSECNN